jgi:hypothetical protein
MLIVKSLLSPHKHALLALCMLFALSENILAGGTRDNRTGRDTIEEAAPPSAEEDNADEAPRQTLDGNISQEDRLRLRRDLDEYSRSTDPDHSQIEERRHAMHQRLQERFSSSDTDNDGSISREEAFATMPQIARHFSQVDLNGDGVITLNELEVAQAKAIERQRAATAKVEAQETDPAKRKSKDVASNRKRTL